MVISPLIQKIREVKKTQTCSLLRFIYRQIIYLPSSKSQNEGRNTPAQSNSSHFPRAALAAQLANDLQGANPFSDAPNGLFLAAPRREGKSVFLQEDLRPALQAAGVVVIYVDLWANKEKDPSLVIAQTIGAELLRHRVRLTSQTVISKSRFCCHSSQLVTSCCWN